MTSSTSPAPASPETNTTNPTPTAGDRFRAEFTPQAWINDHAVAVDAEGPTGWDATAAVTADLRYFTHIAHRAPNTGWNDPVIDCDDVLRDDPDAPDWVRTWHGPFTITIHREPTAP